MRVEKQGTIRATQSDVWKQLWDVQRLVHYIPGVQDVQSVEEGKHYTVRVGDRIGPFQVSFNLDIVIDSIDQGRFLRARVSGKDSRFASTLQQVIEIQLHEALPDGTGMEISTEISILGKLGSLGDALIRTKATEAIANFVTNFKNDVESAQGSGPCVGIVNHPMREGTS